MQKPQTPAQAANRPRPSQQTLGAALKRNMGRRKAAPRAKTPASPPSAAKGKHA